VDGDPRELGAKQLAVIDGRGALPDAGTGVLGPVLDTGSPRRCDPW